MCGLGCLIGIGGKRVQSQQIAAIDRALAHRGPDDRGFFGWNGTGAPTLTREPHELGDSHIMLAHRRLSIIDVGADGWQPMLTEGGSHAIVFNGEIYNYLNCAPSSRRWGAFSALTATPRSVTGVGALGRRDPSSPCWHVRFCHPRPRPPQAGRCSGFIRHQAALLDAGRRLLRRRFRDRRAVESLHGVDRQVDPQSVYDYLRLGFTDRGASTLFANIRRLPAAHWAEIDIDVPAVSPQRYWSIDLNRKIDLSPEAAAERLRELFIDLVRLHLRADVPIGAALSGGVDFDRGGRRDAAHPRRVARNSCVLLHR